MSQANQKANIGTGEQNRRQSGVGGTAAHGNRGSAGVTENIQPDSGDVLLQYDNIYCC